jgi:hypothetical protein
MLCLCCNVYLPVLCLCTSLCLCISWNVAEARESSYPSVMVKHHQKMSSWSIIDDVIVMHHQKHTRLKILLILIPIKNIYNCWVIHKTMIGLHTRLNLFWLQKHDDDDDDLIQQPYGASTSKIVSFFYLLFFLFWMFRASLQGLLQFCYKILWYVC